MIGIYSKQFFFFNSILFLLLFTIFVFKSVLHIFIFVVQVHTGMMSLDRNHIEKVNIIFYLIYWPFFSIQRDYVICYALKMYRFGRIMFSFSLELHIILGYGPYPYVFGHRLLECETTIFRTTKIVQCQIVVDVCVIGI